jgi:hypothetical protein
VRAQAGFAALQAEGDLRQLEWMIGTNAMATGDFERGRPIFAQLATEDEEALGFDFLDLRAIGHAGLAEIDLATGKTESGLSRYREAIAVFSGGGSAPAPWLNMISAACIIAHIRAGSGGAELVDGFAKELRTRILVQLRAQPGFVDKPVLGAASAGLAAWYLWERGDSEPGAARVTAGLELFGLAARLNQRQDLRSLERATLERELRDAWGDEAVETALSSAASLPRDDAVARVVELLGYALRM